MALVFLSDLNASVSGLPTVDVAPVLPATPGVPVITTQPTNQSGFVGGSVVFTIGVSSTPAATLQWKRNGVNISGATSATLTLSGLLIGDNGVAITCDVTNSYGTVTSNSATLSVSAAAVAPSFTTQPISQAISWGQDVSFVVVVTGSPSPTLQWQESTNGGVSWSNISGATGLTLTLTGVPVSSDGLRVRCVATNSQGSATSNSATLTVAATAVRMRDDFDDATSTTITAARAPVPVNLIGNNWQDVINGSALVITGGSGFAASLDNARELYNIGRSVGYTLKTRMRIKGAKPGYVQMQYTDSSFRLRWDIMRTYVSNTTFGGTSIGIVQQNNTWFDDLGWHVLAISVDAAGIFSLTIDNVLIATGTAASGLVGTNIVIGGEADYDWVEISY